MLLVRLRQAIICIGQASYLLAKKFAKYEQ